MARLVLSDTSPLIGLARVDGIVWLRDLFGRVELTDGVLGELEADAMETAIADAIVNGWLVVRSGSDPGSACPPHLGSGEWSTIRAACSAPEVERLVLMDDRLGRREARSRGLTVVGTAAIIGMARLRGLVPSAGAVFERLLRSDFRPSPKVIREILEAVGE